MATSLPPYDPATGPRRRTPGPRAIEALLNAGLQARRDDQLREWIDSRHPRLSGWLDRRWLAVVLGTLGSVVPPAHRRAVAQRELLAWAMSQLRPDHQSGLADIPSRGWLQSTSWRPLLALACHHGFLRVPDFPTHYRRRPDESAVDNLCGLWSVVPSTLYRYMDKGRQMLVDVIRTREPSGEMLLSLRETTWQAIASRPTGEEALAWHRRQADQAQAEARATDALWHALQADDFDLALHVLQRHTVELAATLETDALLSPWAARRRDQRVSFELALATANLWRQRHDALRDNEQLQLALRIANASGSHLLCGRAYAMLGRFQLSRDPDRAFACYDDSVRHLRTAAAAGSGEDEHRATNEWARVLVHLAWLQLRRNDPKSLPLLEQADQLARQSRLADDVQAELEQTWGEYWRCTGELQRALTHKQRALNIYERLGDQRAVLSTCNNLSLIYGEARNFERALHHGHRVLAAAQASPIEPELEAGAHQHLGIAHYYQEQYDQAIEHYLRSLALYERADIRPSLRITHYNLAEAYFHRFSRTGLPEDERQGDFHAGMAVRLGHESQRKDWAASAASLKDNILGERPLPDHLLPEEFAEHFEEMSEVQRQRRRLALPELDPQEQVRARLVVARAYLAIATRERETALSLAAANGLDGQFDEALGELRSTFERSLSQEEMRDAHWKQHAADLLDQERRRRLMAHLREHGSVNKSAFAALSGLGLATASKQLGLLAARGLLRQTGKGPATRYLLSEPG